jgi:CHAT domain-containing protein
MWSFWLGWLAVRAAGASPEELELAEAASAAYESGDFAEARRLTEARIAALEQSYGPNDGALVTPLGELAVLQERLGDPAAASATYVRAVGIGTAAFGRDSAEMVPVLLNLSVFYLHFGYTTQGCAILERLRPVAEEHGSPRQAATALSSLASCAFATGDAVGSRALFLRAADAHQGAGDPLGSAVASVSAAGVLVDIALYRDAVSELRAALAALPSDAVQPRAEATAHLGVALAALADPQAVDVLADGAALAAEAYGPSSPITYGRRVALLRERARREPPTLALLQTAALRAEIEAAIGSGAPLVATALEDEGRLMLLTGDVDGAAVTLGRAYAATVSRFGEGSAQAATTGLSLAHVLVEQGHLDAAADVVRAALTTLETAFGADDPRCRSALLHLSVVAAQRGHLEDSAALLERIRELDGHLYLEATARLAEVRLRQGAFEVADRLAEEVTSAPAAGWLLTAGAWSTRAFAGYLAGDPAAALEFGAHAERLLLDGVGHDDPLVARALNAQGLARAALGDDAGALDAFTRAAAISASHPERRPADIATARINVAASLARMGDLERAEPLLRQNLEHLVVSLGPQHPDVLVTSVNLGEIVRRRGDPGAARVLHEAALSGLVAALGPDAPDVATARLALAEDLRAIGDVAGATDQAREGAAVLERVFGPDHVRVADALGRLAGHLAASGHVDEARSLRTRALDILELRWSTIGTLSDADAVWWSTLARSSLAAWLAAYDRPGDEQACLARVLRWQGLAATRARASHAASRADAASLEALARLRALRGVEGPDAAVEAETRSLERRLASLGEDPEPPPDPDALCQALRRRDVAGLVVTTRTTERTLAFVLRRSESAPDCQVARVDLGATVEVEAAVQRWNELVRRAVIGQREPRAASAVRSLVWDPIEGLLGPGAVYVVPDGSLNQVPWAALRHEAGRFLVEERDVFVLDDARALTRERQRPARAPEALVVSGLDYGEPSLTSTASRSCGTVFEPLDGSVAEGAAVASMLTRRFVDVRSLTATSASQSAVVDALPGKSVVLVSTHGAFSSACARSADPMMRSVLAMSSANEASGGEGLLTAAELATVDLSAARLVVLSACETGVGDPVAGEGVVGLRRALSVAGASAVAVSLWSVGDEGTAALMTDYFERLVRGRSGPAGAWADTQRAAIEDGVDPSIWAAFVVVGQGQDAPIVRQPIPNAAHLGRF